MCTSSVRKMIDGEEEADYTIHQLVSHLIGAYKDRDYDIVERLLTKREETIRGEMVKKLKQEMIEVQDDAMERVKKLELEVELKEGLRKKAEEALHVSEIKFKELELKILSMQKEIDLLKSLGAGDHSTGNSAKKNQHPADAEVERQNADPSVQLVEKITIQGANPVNPVSAANMKQSHILVAGSEDSTESRNQMSKDGVHKGEMRKSSAKHGLGNYIEISSSDDDDDDDPNISNDKSDFSPVQLEGESKLPSESDHDTPEGSVGIKRKFMQCIVKEETETVPNSSVGKDNSPHLLTQEGKKLRPSNESLTPPVGHGTPKPVNSGELKKITKGREICDDDPWVKSMLDKLHMVWDEVASSSSSED